MQPDFKSIMETYHAAKIPVIPLSSERTPLIKEWSKYNKELPLECLYRHGQKGIGFLPGPESGVSWIDVDAVEPSLLQDIEKVIPKSPVKRFGAKGYAIAVKYNSKIPSYKFHNIGVEIFSDSGYIVIPPSHHNKTGKPYVWIGYEFLKIDKDNLPEITEQMIAQLDRMNGASVSAKSSGRNNKLVSIASAMLQRGELFEKVVSEVYEVDKKEHSPRWFMDKDDKWGAKNEDEAQRAAFLFVADLAKGHIKKGYMSPGPSVDVDIKIGDDAAQSNVEQFELKFFPKPKGVLSDFVDLVNEISYTNIPNMSVASALSIYSVLIGNQITFQDTKANIFTLLLGPSGTGKKFGISAAKKILADFGMLGSCDYQSSNAIAGTLSDYCTRLDCSEEFSKTLRLAAFGNTWQANIAQAFCNLWDASEEDYYLPVLTKKSGEKSPPNKISSPFVSVLTSTTLTEFKESTAKSSFTSGFIPRFLFAMDGTSKETKVFLDFDRVEDLTKVCIAHAERAMKIVRPSGVLGTVTPKRITVKKEDEALFNQVSIRFYESTLAEPNETIRSMISRFRQNMKKIALIHAVSCGRIDHVAAEDIIFAQEFLVVSWHNFSRLLSESSAENKQQQEKERVYSIILENPGITQRELTRKTQFLSNSKHRENILLDLEEAELIIKNEKLVSGSKKSLKAFYALKKKGV